MERCGTTALSYPAARRRTHGATFLFAESNQKPSHFDNISDPDVIEHIRRVGVTFCERDKSAIEQA